jgi:L-ascorbate metabolism protein UlaG (beta-lactamase superfamily)
MRITKFGHACVRIEHEGQVVVIDPGSFTDREAVDGATAVLVTHEHFDHYDLEHLAAYGGPVFTIGAVAEQIRSASPAVAERTTVVAPGESFDVGLPVTAVGERHAVIHPSFPGFDNSGYVVSVGDQKVFHPGDSFELPGEPVDLLLLPVSGPWLKLAETLDFAKAVGAPSNLAIHDRILSDVGLGMVDGRVAAFIEGSGTYRRVADGQDL